MSLQGHVNEGNILVGNEALLKIVIGNIGNVLDVVLKGYFIAASENGVGHL